MRKVRYARVVPMRLDKPHTEKLDSRAAELGVTPSTLARMLVIQGLNNPRPGTPTAEPPKSEAHHANRQ